MIAVESLTRKYAGFTIVNNGPFTGQPGRVTGFLGPTCAGTIRTPRPADLSAAASCADHCRRGLPGSRGRPPEGAVRVSGPGRRRRVSSTRRPEDRHVGG